MPVDIKMSEVGAIRGGKSLKRVLKRDVMETRLHSPAFNKLLALSAGPQGASGGTQTKM